MKTGEAVVDGPVTLKGQRTRARLVTAAGEVFCERGFNETRMSDIAERAGVAHGTVYVYFESKSDVLRSVVADLLADIAGYLRGFEAADTASRIAEANERYLRVYSEHARLLQVVEQVGTSDPSFDELLSDFRERHVQRVADGIRRLQSSGSVPPEIEAEVAAPALSAMVEGYARHHRDFDVAEVSRTLTLLWLRALGLTPDGQPPPQP